MTTYYKAVRPDGTDFRTGTVQWAPPAGHDGEWVVSHPTSSEIGNHPSKYLSVATVPTGCTGMQWPCRLLEVEAVGEVITPNPALPHKRAGLAFRVLREVPATLALGPQCEHIAALLSSIPAITGTTANRVALARDAVSEVARDSAWYAAWDATRDGTRDAAFHVARSAPSRVMLGAVLDAARDAVWALIVRDLITTEDYDTLTRPWRTAIGPIHPDDPELG